MVRTKPKLAFVIFFCLCQAILIPPPLIWRHEGVFQPFLQPPITFPQFVELNTPSPKHTKQFLNTSNAGWIPFIPGALNGTAPEIDVISSDLQKLVIRGNFYGMWNWSTSGGLDGIEIPYMGKLTKVGYPELPFVAHFVEIPRGVTVTPRIIQDESSFTMLTGNFSIPHHPGPYYPTNFTFKGYLPNATADPAVYGVDAFYPANNLTVEGASPQDLIIFRGRRIMAVNFVPVQYNPRNGTLRVYSQMVVELVYDRPASLPPLDPRVESPVFTELFNGHLLNSRTSGPPAPSVSRSVKPLRSSLQGSSVSKYLIFTIEQFRTPVEALAEYKEMIGTPTEVITLESLGLSASSPENGKRTVIYNAISDAYHNRETAPDYVLFVGDADHIPPYYEKAHTAAEHAGTLIATDMFYCTVDGPDSMPDILYGRLSANTLEEVDNMVWKILMYTFSPPAASSGFYDQVSSIWNRQEGEFDDYAQNLAKALDDFTDVGLLSYPIDINNSLTDGRFLAYYLGHGDSENYRGASGLMRGTGEGWITPDNKYDIFWVSTMAQRTDTEYPVICSMACDTGWFDGETDKNVESGVHVIVDLESFSSECFCEFFTRMEESGAVAIFGATRHSDVYYNTIFMQGFLDTLWPDMDPTMPNGDEYSLGQLLLSSKLYVAHYEGFSDPYTTQQGESLDRTNMTFQMYHLFGDPQLSFSTDMNEFDVDYRPTLSAGGRQEFVVTVTDQGTPDPVSSAIVSIRRRPDILIAQETNIDGQTTFVLENLPYSPLPMEVVVTKHNYRPHIGQITIFSSSLDASISISPDKDEPPGSTVYLSGEGFNPGEQTQITFGKTTIDPQDCPITDSDDGSIDSWPLTVPAGVINEVDIVVKTSDAEASTTFGGYNPMLGNADPYLYCQNDPTTWHLNSLGADAQTNPRWDNPDIAILGYQIDPLRNYMVVASIHNNGPETAIGTDVIFEYSSWGIGPTEWTEISVERISVSVDSPELVFSDFFQPIHEHICVRVRIEYQSDINSANNIGLENLYYVKSPVGPTYEGLISIPVFQPQDQAVVEIRDLTGSPADPMMYAERERPYLGSPDLVKVSVYIDQYATLGAKRIINVKSEVGDELLGGVEIILVKVSPYSVEDNWWYWLLIIAIIIIVLIIIVVIRKVRKKKDDPDPHVDDKDTGK
jgi:hypothetical protein